jgi:hypothetical protein
MEVFMSKFTEEEYQDKERLFSDKVMHMATLKDNQLLPLSNEMSKPEFKKILGSLSIEEIDELKPDDIDIKFTGEGKNMKATIDIMTKELKAIKEFHNSIATGNFKGVKEVLDESKTIYNAHNSKNLRRQVASRNLNSL